MTLCIGGCVSRNKCAYVAAWEMVDKHYHFHLLGRSDGYIALGLSKDTMMGHDATAACIFDPMQDRVIGVAGYNYGFTNRMLNPTSRGIFGFEGSFDDGVIECK